MSTTAAKPIAEAFAPPPWHQTKVVCTLGQATDPPGVLERLRLNRLIDQRTNNQQG